MSRKPTGNNVVVQSNSLVEAKYSLSLAEQRIVLAVISLIAPSDENFREYRLRASDLADLFGVDKESFYRASRETLRRLLGRVLEIPEGKGYLMTHWLSSARYVPQEGILTLSFDPKLKPYLLRLKREFTRYRLAAIVGMKSQYSIRLYQLAKQYESLRERTISLEQLREMLSLEDRYGDYSDLRKRVLAPAEAEITKKTDLNVVFRPIKEGKKVRSIRLMIGKKRGKPKEALPRLPPTPEQKENASRKCEELRGIIKGRKKP